MANKNNNMRLIECSKKQWLNIWTNENKTKEKIENYFS